MVSGLVTSPWDQLRIFSGEARLMRIASKSAITFAISNGLERNKVFLRFLLSAGTGYLVPDTEFCVPRDSRAPNARDFSFQTFKSNFLDASVPAPSTQSDLFSELGTRYCLVRRGAGRGLLLAC